MPTIAIIGASIDHDKFGNKAVRAYAMRGWMVYPVNPTAPEIEGLKTYRTILDVPRPIDRVSLYLPPKVGMTVVEDIAKVGPTELFLNPGTESPALIKRAAELGITVIVACSIVAIGISPAQLS